MSDRIDQPGLEASDPPRPGSALWWRHSALRLRAGMAFGLIALVLSAGLAFAAYAVVRTSLLEDRMATSQRQAMTNARLLRSRLDPAPADMTTLLAGLQLGSGGEALLRLDGDWFSSSVDLSDDMLPDTLIEAVQDGSAAVQRFDTGPGPMLGVGIPIVASDAEYYEVASLENLESGLASLGRSLLVAASVATVIGAALGSWFSSLILAPLRRFAGVARQVADGETDRRLDATGDPDLEPLASSFNEMLDELDERIERERRFASDVSHEIRGPLATLAAAVSIVDRRRDRLPEEVVPAVDALDAQVREFNQLVQDLLEISRFDARTASLEIGELDLVALCRQVIEERGHDGVALHTGTDSVVVPADARRIGQVVANLLDNARIYAGGATDLTVSMNGDAVAVVVEDRGPGVPAEEREEIFERFHRGREARRGGAEGSGLGLALSSQHIHLHRGTLTVEDRPGGGARFIATWSVSAVRAASNHTETLAPSAGVPSAGAPSDGAPSDGTRQ